MIPGIPWLEEPTRPFDPQGRAHTFHPMLKGCTEWWLAVPGAMSGTVLRNWIRPANSMALTGQTHNISTSGWRGESHPGGLGSYATDGVNDAGTSGPVPSLDQVTQFTWVAWMRRFATNQQCYIQYNPGGIGAVILHPSIEMQCFQDGNTYWTLGDTARTFGQFVSSDALQWVCYIMVYNGAGATNADRLKAYTNGVPRTLTFTGTIPSATGLINKAVVIGRDDPSNNVFVRAQYNDIAVYNYAMSPEQVVRRYHWALLSWPGGLPYVGDGFSAPTYLWFEPPGGTGHPVDRLTQLGPHGVPMQLYGDFGGRGAGPVSPHPVDRLTQLGPHGVPMQLYGDFGGRGGGGGPGTPGAGIYIPIFRPRRR